VKKPAVKKTSKKPAAKALRARPTAKPAPRHAAPAKSKPATAKKKTTMTKKPAAAKKTSTSKAPVRKAAPPKKAATGKKASPVQARSGRAAAPVAKKTVARPTAAKSPAEKWPTPAPKPAGVSKADAATKPQAAQSATPSSKVAVPVPTLAPGAPLATPNGFVPRKPGRGTPKYFVAPVQAPLPPPTSRFADRFAPPRPPTRQMNKQEHDTPRQAHKADPKLANAWKSKAGRDLTDDELLAMPESEYMNEKQLEFFRMKLQALKDDLLSNAGETTEHLREDTSIVPDPADRATIEEEHALELRTRDRERKLLKKISQSLARIDSGEYGFCDETGEPIGLGRLIARPTATLSLEAQQRRELKQKMFGD
jgi:DnaK suppressor protein